AADPSEHAARRLAESMAVTLQASLLVRHGHPAVADAFAATRLAGEGGRAYGTLPPGTRVQDIIPRATPQTWEAERGERPWPLRPRGRTTLCCKALCCKARVVRNRAVRPAPAPPRPPGRRRGTRRTSPGGRFPPAASRRVRPSRR